MALAWMIIFPLTRLRNNALYDGQSRQKVLLCDSAKSVDSIWNITMHTVHSIKFGMDKLPTLLTKEPQTCPEVRHPRDNVVLQKVTLWSDSTPTLPYKVFADRGHKCCNVTGKMSYLLCSVSWARGVLPTACRKLHELCAVVVSYDVWCIFHVLWVGAHMLNSCNDCSGDSQGMLGSKGRLTWLPIKAPPWYGCLQVLCICSTGS